MENTNETAVVSRDQQQKVLKQALSKIDRRLKALGQTDAASLVMGATNWKMNELDGNSVNILTYTDPQYLIKALACARRIKEEYIKTAEEVLGLKEYPACLWLSVSIDAWISNLTIRAKIVLNQAQITQLNNARANLTAFLSTEEKLAEALQKAADLLK